MTQNAIQPDPPSRPVRLVDIAARAGVSRTTVASVVLKSAGPHARVSMATAQRILDAANELGYRPNTAAQRLAGKQSKIIGALIDSYAPVPSYRRLSEVERLADEYGYRVMIGQSHGELRKIESYADDFLANGVDGVICISHNYPDVGRRVAEIVLKLRNVVFLERPITDAPEACWVSADHRFGTCKLVEHFASKGRRRIVAWLPPPEYQDVRDRRQGYLEGLEASGLPVSDELCLTWKWDEVTEPRSGIYARVPELLKGIVAKHKPDAIMAENDVMALHVVRALHAMGLRVPEDIAVSGYDNLPLTDLVSPSITTVDLRARETAQVGMEMLMSLIDGRPLPSSQRHRFVRPVVVGRQSA